MGKRSLHTLWKRTHFRSITKLYGEKKFPLNRIRTSDLWMPTLKPTTVHRSTN